MPEHRFYIVIFILLIFLFPIRLFVYQKFHQPLLDDFIGKTLRAKGVVVEEPEEKSFYQQVIVDIEGIPRQQKMLVQAAFYPRFKYGDQVTIEGKLKVPKDFKTDAGRTFPYQKYLAKDNIYYILSAQTVVLVSEDHGNPLKSHLFAIKDSFISHIQKVLPRPESSLLSGMLIAGKGGLGTSLEKDFKVHIVVLSGYNVTIVAEAFVKVLSFLPRGVALGSGAVGIILFAVMAGGSSTIIRASIMALIALLGKQTGNMYNALRGLFVAGIIMVLWNPLILRYDPSFHLSFMATFALIVGSPLVKKIIPWAGEIICSTLAVQIFLLPYLLWMNGSFAFVTFPANLLVLSFLPFTMLAGFVATVSSYFSYGHLNISYPFAFVSFVMLRYILRIVEMVKGWVGWGISM
jgi:competence protein ComEC